MPVSLLTALPSNVMVILSLGSHLESEVIVKGIVVVWSQLR